MKGGLTAAWQDDRFSVKKADLQGRGFNLTADGTLDEHLKFEAQVADLSQLLPDGHGTGSAKGWVRWRNRKLGGQVVLQGRDFSWEKLKAGSFALEAGYDQEKTDTAIELKTRIKKGTYHSITGRFLDAPSPGHAGPTGDRTFRAGPPGKDSGRFERGLSAKPVAGNPFKPYRGASQRQAFSPPVSGRTGHQPRSSPNFILGADRRGRGGPDPRRRPGP